MTGASTVLALATVALAATIPTAAVAAGCQLVKVADLKVTMAGLQPQVSVKIDGKDALFLVDSGAFYSSLTSEAVAKYGLKTYPAPSTFFILSAAGSHQRASITKVAEFTYADIPIRHIDFLVAGASPAPGVSGVIGQNLLGALDVEYDLANGVIRLFQANDCGDSNLAYWSAGKPLSILGTDQQTAKRPHIVTDARINGHSIKVMFDTGASTSMLNKGAAARAGIDVSAKSLTPSGYTVDFAGQQIESSVGSLPSFGIGDEEIKNTRLRIADVQLSGVEMLIGDDFFLSHRVIVARSQHKLYFTYNGGPVFRLDQQPKLVAQVEAPPPKGPASAPAADGAVTADDLSRRGAASAARRDYPAALSDFSAAIALEPKESRHYYVRAVARLAAGQKVLAMADLDQALNLKPDFQDALIVRGGLRLKAKDLDGGQADFNAAMAAAPTDRQLPLRLAHAYNDAHLFNPALQLYDAWIAARPDDAAMGSVLNARCWTRALAGTDLEKALADCDAALKRRWTSAVMDSRGLVLLRLGRFDEAISQYNTAIRLSPKSSWSLYGRGLAKLKMGRTAEGQADIQAAITFQPGIRDEAKGYGIGPGQTPTNS